MANLIDKGKVVAEIEREIKEYSKSKAEYSDDEYYEGALDVLENFRNEFLDTLETKEVDLEKEFGDYIEKQNIFTNNDNSEIKYYNGDSFNHVYDIYPIAKHFFELGLKAEEE